MAAAHRAIVRPVLLAAAALLSTAQSLAQQARSEPSAVERCLTLAEAATETSPEYPLAAFKRGVAGRVTAELVFTLADRAPAVHVLNAESSDKSETGAIPASDFEAAVRRFARHYRVPCLTAADAPARLAIEYVFRREQTETVHGQPQDLVRAQRDALWRCVRHTSGRAQLAYPRNALQAQLQGRVFSVMRFTAADQAPEVQVFARDGAAGLAAAVTEWAAGLRMPCQTGGPFETTVTYHFVLERDAFGFKPGIGFSHLLRAMPPAVREKMPRDTTGMGCPFTVRLSYTQPLRPNTVGVVAGGWSPARTAFLDWLRTVELNLPDESLDSVFADDVDFTVPCVKIQPTP